MSAPARRHLPDCSNPVQLNAHFQRAGALARDIKPRGRHVGHRLRAANHLARAAGVVEQGRTATLTHASERHPTHSAASPAKPPPVVTDGPNAVGSAALRHTAAKAHPSLPLRRGLSCEPWPTQAHSCRCFQDVGQAGRWAYRQRLDARPDGQARAQTARVWVAAAVGVQEQSATCGVLRRRGEWSSRSLRRSQPGCIDSSLSTDRAT